MKTFFVDLDESLPDLLDKITDCPSDQILLIIPQGAGVFQNPVSLKVLKSKTDALKKEIQIYTNDKTGQQLAKNTGIRLYQGTVKKRKSQTAMLQKLPLKKPERKKSEFSITDISTETRKRIDAMPISKPQKREQKKVSHELAATFFHNTLKKKMVIGFTLVAAIIFWMVFSIAIPSATIAIRPASNVLDTTVNILFANPETQKLLFRNPSGRVLPLTPVSATFEETLIIPATGKVFTGTNAQCILKVMNLRTSPWTLVEKTRFQDRNGIIFRSQDPIELPAARIQISKDKRGNPMQEKIPGTLLITVLADERDEDGTIIGSRGNLPYGTIFHLPGLSETNQSMITATNEKPCEGGSTASYSVITDEDVVAGQKKMQEFLKKTAQKYLADMVSAENLRRLKDPVLEKSELVLFSQPEIVQYSVLGITVPSDIKGKKSDEFSVSGKMSVRGLAYQKTDFDQMLEDGLLAKVHPDKTLTRLDADSSTSVIVYSDSDLKGLNKIKISVTVRGIEQYNLDPKSEKGKKLFQKILDVVPGKSPSEVNYFLTNLPEIEKAHVSIWPFWKKNVPERKGRITIRIE